MAKFLARQCPQCREYFGVVVNEPPRKSRELPVHGFCAVCGYQLKGWKVIIGGNRKSTFRYVRMPKVFRDA